MAELEGEDVFEFHDIAPAELKVKITDGRVHHIHASIRIYRTVLGVGADYDIHFALQLNCVRCLEPFRREFSASYTLTFVEGEDPNAGAEKVNLKTTDIYKVYYHGTHIDLSTGIREAIMLNIPIAALCTESCKGLCPVCGKNRNKYTCHCKTKITGLFTPVNTAQLIKGKKGDKR